jgi:hypothetical protein
MFGFDLLPLLRVVIAGLQLLTALLGLRRHGPPPPAPWAAGGGGGADRAAGGAARPWAGGDRPARPPAAGPDHRRGRTSAGPRRGLLLQGSHGRTGAPFTRVSLEVLVWVQTLPLISIAYTSLGQSRIYA